ncbi:F-box only protein 33 [Lingula anatina]|uniref:F-box only protein 33 n=1 Tax=Lingula anatina TaxID=7574 RepID=A0A1S3ID74_LINAN|nr:F-box only protein 33 [Lingula anatina]|eukprot:XP_013396215.1 F-box only protein 33 [Lingula anatina]
MAAESSWAVLPSIIIVQILAYLTPSDRLKASATCRRWRSCLFESQLWESITFDFTNGNAEGAKFLTQKCSSFVTYARAKLSFCTADYVLNATRLLSRLSRNRRLRRLAIQPKSNYVEWLETSETQDNFVDSLIAVTKHARKLEHLSLGCIQELTDYADTFIAVLSQHEASKLRALHLESVKEDPDDYGLIELPLTKLNLLHNLQVLGIDFDHLSNSLLEGFIDNHKAKLEKLIVNVHGIHPAQEQVRNHTWWRLTQHSPKLRVTLNLIHSADGVEQLMNILKPDIPLAILRLFFCTTINAHAIDFISKHHCETFENLYVVEGLDDGNPNTFEDQIDDGNMLVMLAWRCKVLKHITFIGYLMESEDLACIARLRGPGLETLQVPESCIGTVPRVELAEDEDIEVEEVLTLEELTHDVSHHLQRPWKALSDGDVPAAVIDEEADAEQAYLPLLLQDQQW